MKKLFKLFALVAIFVLGSQVASASVPHTYASSEMCMNAPAATSPDIAVVSFDDLSFAFGDEAVSGAEVVALTTEEMVQTEGAWFFFVARVAFSIGWMYFTATPAW